MFGGRQQVYSFRFMFILYYTGQTSQGFWLQSFRAFLMLLEPKSKTSFCKEELFWRKKTPYAIIYFSQEKLHSLILDITIYYN
jgi:hypothetical protein